MRKGYLLLFLTVLSNIPLFAQDWASTPIAASAGTDSIWVLQEDYSDDFNYSGKGTDFTDKWNDTYFNGWLGPGKTEWASDHSSITDGNLVIGASRKTGTDKVYCGVITSKTKVTYPIYIEGKIKVSNQVLSSNLWLLSDDDEREIDILEVYGGDRADQTWFAANASTNYHVFVRDSSDNSIIEDLNDQKHHSLSGNEPYRNDYHTFAAYWKDAWNVDFYYDGVLVRSLNKEGLNDPANEGLERDMYLIIDTEDHEWRSNQGIVATDEELADDTKNKMYVDWVRVYKPAIDPNANIINTFEIQSETFDTTGGTFDDGNIPYGVLANEGSGISWVNLGDWASYHINVTTEGMYHVSYNVTTPDDNTGIQISLNDTIISTDNVPNTGSYNNYQTVNAQDSVYLTPGNHKITITATGSNNWQWNLDNIIFTRDSSVTYVNGISLSPTSLSLEVGDTSSLTAVVTPSSATDTTISYSSSNTNVATVNQNGLVTAIEAGTAIITATSTDGGYTATSNITVALPIIDLTGNNFYLQAGDLHATGGTFDDGNIPYGVNATPGGGISWVNLGDWASYNINVEKPGNYHVSYRLATPDDNTGIQISLNDTIVSTDDVPNTGAYANYEIVNAQDSVYFSEGTHTVKITASGTNNWQWNLDKIYFSRDSAAYMVTGVSLNPTTLDLTLGDSSQVTSTISPINAENKGVQYSTSDASVATVNADGWVYATGGGTATITVTTDDGGHTANCSITVTEPFTEVFGNEFYIQAGDIHNTGGTFDDGNVPYGVVASPGSVISWVNAGDWASYNILVEQAGKYHVSYEITTPSDNAEIQLSLGDTLIATDAVPNNGSWGDYQVLNAQDSIDLTQGLHTIKVTGSGTNNWQWNLRKIIFTRDSTVAEEGLISKDSLMNRTPDTRWTAGGWTGGSPDSTQTISIDTDTQISSDFTCKYLIIKENESLYIPEGMTITIKGAVLNNGNGITGGGKIRFESTKDTLQLYEQMSIDGIIEITDGTILQTNEHLVLENGALLLHEKENQLIGAIQTSRTGKSAPLAYNFWSIPVQEASNLDSITDTHQYIYNEPSSTWQANPGSLTAAQGIIATGSGVVTVVGTPYADSVSIATTHQGTNATYRGFNLIGNPFLAPLDYDAFVASNTNITDGALYFYTGNADGSGTYTTVNSGNKMDIPTFQGFFVHVASDGMVDFFHQHKVANDNSNFVRTQKLVETNIPVQIKTADYQDQLQLMLGASFTEASDYGYDAQKLFGDQSLAISFTAVNGVENSMLALPTQAHYDIPLTVKAASEATIKITDTNVFQQYDLYLVESQTGKRWDLATEQAVLSNVSNNKNNYHLEITAKAQILSTLSEAPESLKATFSSTGFQLENLHNEKVSIMVNDITGKEIVPINAISNQNTWTGTWKLPTEKVLVITIRQQGNITVEKVVFK